MRADHGLDRLDAMQVAAFVHQPIHFLEHAGVDHVRMHRIIAGKPDDAVGVGFLGRLANRHAAAIDGLAAVGRVLLPAQLVLAGEFYAHQFLKCFFFRQGSHWRQSGSAIGHPNPIDHEAVDSRSSSPRRG